MRYEAMLPFKFRMQKLPIGLRGLNFTPNIKSRDSGTPLGRDYGSIFCHGTHHMKTLDLQGNLLNLYVALAMGGFDESSGSWAPFDYWEGTIRYRDQEFSPSPTSPQFGLRYCVSDFRLTATMMGSGQYPYLGSPFRDRGC